MLDNNDVLKILDYAIPILPVTQLAGIVNHVRTDKNGNYICFIKPLNQDWFTSEGELIDSLFCYLGESPRDINDQEISNDNYVSFQWDKSQWEIHKRKNAINIQNITEETIPNNKSVFQSFTLDYSCVMRILILYLSSLFSNNFRRPDPHIKV